MKFKRNGRIVFWSIGGIGGSIYMTRRAQVVAANLLSYAALMGAILLMGVLYAH